MRLEGRAAIVTGASGGIGSAIARVLAREGANVVNLDVVAPSEGETAYGEYLSGDVSRARDCLRAVERTLQRYGRLDILVNNAATSAPGRIDAPNNEEILRRVMDVNLFGPFLMLQHAIPPMRESGRGGAIVNVASIAADVVNPAVHPSYAASKGGLVALTHYVAVAYAKYQIRCNAISPGAVVTRMWQTLPDETRETYEQLHPLGTGTPDDVAELALFLASDESRWMSGSVIRLDGGNLSAGGLASYTRRFF